MNILDCQELSLSSVLNEPFLHNIVRLWANFYDGTHTPESGEAWQDGLIDELETRVVTSYPLMNLHILPTLGKAQHRRLSSYEIDIKQYGYILLVYPFSDFTKLEKTFVKCVDYLESHMRQTASNRNFEYFNIEDYFVVKGNKMFLFYYLPYQHEVEQLRNCSYYKVDDWIMNHWYARDAYRQVWHGDVLTCQEDAIDEYTKTEDFVNDDRSLERWYLDTFVTSPFNYYWRVVKNMLDTSNVDEW